eukprot:TRINITY_DN2799_c0_g1_i1.p1 TRINITY_DN2799_c0_g1~~TRINITY_DN2799_c0_g1_i1.p1  ORF type:complete len:119 (+),score=25.59 TRINITY_DN2799_c0_g1_i1:98-454(+)
MADITVLGELRAGKCTVEGTLVKPEPAKGLLQLFKSLDDELTHFIWKERTAAAPDQEFILFPDDAVFKPVTECKTGTVYVLEFKTPLKRHFYWVQDTNTQNATSFASKVNTALAVSDS